MDATSVSVDRERISDAYERIRPYVRKTPLLQTGGRDFGLLPARFAFKLESMQISGSFKARGAFANLVMREVPASGVAAASGGNHGAAVAYAAMRRGVKARIFVPTVSSAPKVARIREYGAELIVGGERYGDTVEACAEYCRQSGALNIHAFDQEQTLLGTGTVGMEIQEQFPDVETVIVAVGGGGLIAGIASWFAGTNVRVIGVEPEDAPTLTRALEAGRPVDAPANSIASDSLAPRRVGETVFPIASRFVSRVLLVNDDEIRTAQRALWTGLGAVAEPGGAAAFAAVLCGKYQPREDERVCVVISGSNASPESFVAA
ncbi:MAG TPA: threonine/serine dehydratase [Candidatus Baltobacteraceae bacterium]|jgi:threonine dehydratase|nr:threonine/serine dehydratase [Candidatus Baltobacteraceae bacterium]